VEEVCEEAQSAQRRLGALAILSEAAAGLDPRPGVMLSSAEALAVALKYRGQQAVLKSFHLQEQIKFRLSMISSWRDKDAQLQQVGTRSSLATAGAPSTQH
jgi:hypothetical protein